MNHFIAGILRIAILEASAALVIVDQVFSPSTRRVRMAFAAIAALAVLAFINFGQVRGGGRMIHHWEQFHFFFGSKYLPEIGYFDIYKAALLADRESAGILGGVREIRDLHTFELVAVADALADGGRVRGRFTDRRWQAFKQDWATLARAPAPWPHVLRDHGNSASPAWAILAWPLASLIGVSPAGQHAMAALDLVLIAAMFVMVFRTFGAKAGYLTLAIWCLVPFCFDYLAGSFLRWDWLCASVLAVCLYRRGRFFTAGACLGYAVASKLFPVLFAVALAGRFAADLVRRRRLEFPPRRLLRFAAGGAASVALAVALSSAVLRRPQLWAEYKARIDVTRLEKFYPNQYSLRTVFLQAAESQPGAFLRGWMVPTEIKQARADVDVRRHRVGLLAVQFALTALLFAALARTEEWAALCMGPFLVLVWLVVNAYYWNMLALPALAWMAGEPRRAPSLVGLAGLHVVLGGFYLYQHLGRGYAEGYFVGCLLLVLLVVWAAAELADRRSAARQVPDSGLSK